MRLERLWVVAGGVLAGTLCVALDRKVPAVMLFAGCMLAPLDRAHKALLAAALTAGIANASLRGEPAAYADAPVQTAIRASVLDVAPAQTFGSEFVARDSARRQYQVESKDAPPAAGATVVISGRLESFDLPRNPGEPSAQALAAERGLYARIERASVRVVAAPDMRAPDTWLAQARAWASAQVRSRIAEPQATILAGALWGERGALPPDLRAEFQETGTMHVLVTAGLHVGIVAALLATLLRLCGSGRATVALATILTVWIYAAWSGAHLPSLRAATMATFALVAFGLGRRALSWSALAAAATVVVFIWPWSLASVSFALSFSCVAAILLFAAPIAAWLHGRRLPAIVAEAIALSIATQIGTWPLTAQTFFVIAPYAVAANAFVVPITGAAIVCGAALLASSGVPLLPDAIASIASVLLAALSGVVHAVSALPGARTIVTPPPTWTLILYGITMPVAAALVRARRAAAAGLVFAIACACVVLAPVGGTSDLRVTVLDVGQGDAIVIQTPAGHTVLIDSGGRLERGIQNGDASPAERVGERTVVPFLLRQGIRTIDAVILTHPHGDHVGGCAPILRTLSVDRIADNGRDYGGFAFRDCHAQAQASNVPVVHPQPGARWTFDDGVSLTFLAPSQPFLADTEDDENENSIVTLLQYRAFRMLLMGDAGEFAEQRLLRSGIDLHADVLKVGHHGSASATSPAFLRAVSPRYAVISVGRDNTFGHPAAQTLEALERAGVRTYRTDRCGAVIVENSGAVHTMVDC